MKKSLGKLGFNQFKRSLPWISCFVVFLLAVLIAGFEVNVLWHAKLKNRVEALTLSDLESTNQKNSEQIDKASNRLNALNGAADSILGGLLKEGQEDPDLSILEELGLQEIGTTTAEDVVRIRYSSSALEYHAFVPALNQQESDTPLMRCTWISLRSTGKPFHTSALPLQIDLELAFPKATPAQSSASNNSGSR